jgi:hypothetical protein
MMDGALLRVRKYRRWMILMVANQPKNTTASRAHVSTSHHCS